MDNKLTSGDLSQFCGTENYYRHKLGRFVYTDGVQYMAEQGGAYWLIDAIGSYLLTDKRLRQGRLGDFQCWKLTLKPNNKAVLTCIEDDGIPPIIAQEIEYTDFPFDIKLFVCASEQGPCLMLPSEY